MFFFSEERNPDLMRRGNRFTTDKAYIQRVESISSRFEFVCGDKDSDYIFLRCKDCGFIRRYAKTGIKPSHIGLITCNYCTDILKEIRQKELNEKRKCLMLEREQRQKKKIKRICKRCGKEIEGRRSKFCSKICARRQQDADAEHVRRLKANSNIHDAISLQMLVKRDKGKCWICGKKIDYSDHKVREDGTFIAGKNYPSIDHVVALSVGGTHTWNNVRLAHMKCNTAKSNKVFGEKDNGQIILFC